MKEPVRSPKNPLFAGICVVGIVGLYFYLLGTSSHPEPGANLKYDITEYAELDRVETRFEETGRIEPDVEDAWSLAQGPDGTLYVGGQDVVAVFDADGNETGRFPLEGKAVCMAGAPDGPLYIGFTDHIAVMNPAGEITATWSKLEGRPYLTSIAVSENDVYVGDMGNRVVYRFNREGALQTRIGLKDEDKDVPGIVVPSPYFDVAINPEGTLWVVNPGRLGLESYRPNGDIITSWYRPSMKLDGFPGCCNPSHITFDQDGRLIAADKGLVRIKAYEVTSGELEELVAGTEVFPRERAVKDIIVDNKNRILVLDPRYNAIRIFEATKEVSDHVAAN